VEDLSLHILDIAENSIRAHAHRIEVELVEDRKRDVLTLTVTDDGEGMDEEARRKATNPFFTTKEEKRAGLGLALLSQAAEEAGGGIVVEAQKGRGTRVTATFLLSHIDRKPFGDIEKTIRCLEAAHPEIAFRFTRTIID